MRLQAVAIGLLVGGLFASGAQAARAEPGAEEASYSISGKLKDQTTGSPVPGIEVSAWDGSDNGGWDTTDARGRYRIEVPYATAYSVDFQDPDERYIGVNSFPGVKVDGHERYNQRLVRGGAIRARVLGKAGPLGNVALDLCHRHAGNWVKEVPYGVHTDAAGRISIPLLSPDAEGKFTMGSLAAHPYKVCAINNLVTGCLGGGPDPDDSTTVRLSRGEVRDVRIVVPWP